MVYSVFIYGITFAISLIFIYIYDKYEEKLSNNKILKYLCIVEIILPPVILATLRYGIGVDYFSYIDNYLYLTSNMSFSNIFSSYQEPLCMIIYYLAKIIFNSYIGFFFIASLITVIFTFLGIKNYKGKIPLWFPLFIFFMFYYQISYNLVRQGIAVAVVFFAYKYALDKKIVKYVFWIIIAGLFHKSAFICVLFYFLCPKKETEISKKIDIILYISIILSPVIIPIIIKFIPSILNFLGIYTSYANLELTEYQCNFLLYIIPTLIPIFAFKKEILKADYRYNFFIRVILLQIPLQFAGNYIAYTDRIALYSSVVQISLIPIMINSIENEKKRKLVKYGMIGWYLFYYIGMFVVLNSNITYPYISIFIR